MKPTEDVRQPHSYHTPYRTASSNPSVSVPLYKLAGSETIFWESEEGGDSAEIVSAALFRGHTTRPDSAGGYRALMRQEEVAHLVYCLGEQ